MIKVHSSEKYEKARDFRKRGFSYSEIAKIVGVSKSTVSNWFAKETFSKKVKKDNEIKAQRENVKRIQLVNKARDKERNKYYAEAKRVAVTEFKHFKATPLFLIGLATYLTAGDLTHPSQIRLPSQRAGVHKRFKRFLVEFLGADKQKIYSQSGVTILNDALSKKKLLVWIDRLG